MIHCDLCMRPLTHNLFIEIFQTEKKINGEEIPVLLLWRFHETPFFESETCQTERPNATGVYTLSSDSKTKIKIEKFCFIHVVMTSEWMLVVKNTFWDFLMSPDVSTNPQTSSISRFWVSSIWKSLQTFFFARKVNSVGIRKDFYNHWLWTVIFISCLL